MDAAAALSYSQTLERIVWTGTLRMPMPQDGPRVIVINDQVRGVLTFRCVRVVWYAFAPPYDVHAAFFYRDNDADVAEKFAGATFNLESEERRHDFFVQFLADVAD